MVSFIKILILLENNTQNIGTRSQQALIFLLYVSTTVLLNSYNRSKCGVVMTSIIALFFITIQVKDRVGPVITQMKY